MRSICRLRLHSSILRARISSKPQQTTRSISTSPYISSSSKSSISSHRHRHTNRIPLSTSTSFSLTSRVVSYYHSTSKMSSSQQDQEQTKPQQSDLSDHQPEKQQQPLALPPATSDGSQSSTIEVNGAALKLDHLGPLVVNEDGTMSRIANWDKMIDIERENTLRKLGKRNQMRLAKLRAAAAAQKPESEKEQKN
ncbi:hypothetical protein F5Y17DRAFT_436434 [Xylariaceae sp. FL0594]|nr:hypothetical protein F5Y17DRAFT_436434 [Xylariaceae sp. FL0594]